MQSDVATIIELSKCCAGRDHVPAKPLPPETGKLEAEVKEAASSFEAPVPVVDDPFVRPRLDPTLR
jgi:hypothetical protein